MTLIAKKHIPIVFLVLISLSWSVFYQSANWLNDDGNNLSEWWLLIDGFIVLPFICLICIKNKKEALIKAIAYACLIVILGSYVIPESSKLIWPYLESGRYLLVAAFIVFELITIITVVLAIKASLQKEQDPDLAISQPIEQTIGRSSIATLLAFEARVWTYLLFAKRIDKAKFRGTQHYYGFNKDGTQSNMLGFILLMLFELPIMHLLLHFVWSPFAANVVSGLTLLGLVFFIAEYKAIAIRPVSIYKDKLVIRYSVWAPREVPFSDIIAVSKNEGFVRRADKVTRYNLSGHPNVKIALSDGSLIYLGLDTPKPFVEKMSKMRA